MPKDLSEMSSNELLYHFAPYFSRVEVGKKWLSPKVDKGKWHTKLYFYPARDGHDLSYSYYREPYISIAESGMKIDFSFDGSADEGDPLDIFQQVIFKSIEELFTGAELHIVPGEKCRSVENPYPMILEVRGKQIPSLHIDQRMRTGWTTFVPLESPEGQLIEKRAQIERQVNEEERVKEQNAGALVAEFEKILAAQGPSKIFAPRD